ncbi:MAG: hypothetical protein OXC62_07005 [Aestuariivita sp.]|nr:hypothetical protein [Aestuariivita sp.]
MDGRDHSGFAVEVEAQDKDSNIFTIMKAKTFEDVKAGKVLQAKIIWENLNRKYRSFLIFSHVIGGEFRLAF